MCGYARVMTLCDNDSLLSCQTVIVSRLSVGIAFASTECVCSQSLSLSLFPSLQQGHSGQFSKTLGRLGSSYPRQLPKRVRRAACELSLASL